MLIERDDLTRREVHELLALHAAGMLDASPEDACHFLDLEALRRPEITFWTAWDDGGDTSALAGCGALREIDASHGEVKSMRTHPSHLRRGVAAALLVRLLDEARGRGYRRLSLETGTGPDFEAAHALYERHGFVDCKPFDSYKANDFSRFMSLSLA